MTSPVRFLPKRILMTADTVGGVWTYALELTRALASYGIEVDLATMGPPISAAQRHEAAAIPNLNLFKSEYRLEWMENSWRDVDRAGDWLLHLEQRLRPDIVHLNGFSHAALPWNAPTVLVAHSCVFSWWRSVHKTEPPPEWNIYYDRVRRGLAKANLVIAPSESMLATLGQNYGRLTNARVILNGRGANGFFRGKKENLVFAAGRVWDEAKNVRAVIEISPQLEWQIAIAGETNNPTNFRPEFSDGANTQFLGRLNSHEMQQWLSRAAIFVAPARYEPFGLGALEAALSGCALLLGDIPSLREIWQDTAVFVAPDDSSLLLSKLNQLIDEPNFRKTMAKRSFERALTFDSRRMAENYALAYSELLHSRSSRQAKSARWQVAHNNVLPVANL